MTHKSRLAAAASGFTVLTMASCGGSSEIKQTADEAPREVTVTVTETETDTVEATTEASGEDPSGDGLAGLGDTITLLGFEDGEEVAVTVKRVIEPAKAAQYFGPSQGHKLVAVELVLQNTGSAPYDDSPGNGAQLIDNRDQGFTETITETPSCHYIGSSVKIAPGSRRSGCLVFELPKRSKPALFQFALNSGFADQAGEWRLR